MAEIQDPRTSNTFSLLEWITDRLRPLAKLRDGLLVVAAIVYILGYLVWSLNAWVNNLGLLPALEFQYFVAGIFPALVIWLVYIGIRNTRRLVDNLTKWFGPSAKRGLLILRWPIRFCFGGGILGCVLWTLGVRNIPFIPVSILFIATAPLWWATEKSCIFRGVPPRFMHWYRLIIFHYVFIAFCALGLYSYIFVIYPKLPQAVGGLRPRCVYLDIKKAGLSNEILEDIFPVDAVTSNSEVVRSVKLDVFFLGGEFMRLRPHVEKQDARLRVYEIRKSVVQAVISCK
ncbi:hypothetical protein ES702_02432 [subsurface metagenome]